MMKKILFLIVVFGVLTSCSHDPEPEAIVKPDSETTSKPAVKVYFSEANIQRIGVIDLKEIGTFSTLLDYDHNNMGVPAGIAINQGSKRLYISEQDKSIIHRINLDSTLYNVVYDSDDGVGSPKSIAVDTVSKKIYWANSDTKQIMSGDLFGKTEIVILFSGAEVIENCYGIAIDNKNNKIYFSDNTLHQISVGNLDGSGTPTVIFDEGNTENVGCPSSLVLSEGKLYWTDDCFNNILSAGLVPSEKPVALFGPEDGISYPTGIDIDRAGKKIYWSETDGNAIARGNLDGTGGREIILENIQATSISLELE